VILWAYLCLSWQAVETALLLGDLPISHAFLAGRAPIRPGRGRELYPAAEDNEPIMSDEDG
jgi:hypothetical protein